VDAVLFDFSGTLFRVESTEAWLRAVLRTSGVTLPESEVTGAAQALEIAGALPGGVPPQRLPTHLVDQWADRDRSADLHRAAYTGLSRQVTLPDESLHDALYDRHRMPDAWLPYPDTEHVLRTLHERGTAVGVVSNIGWDLRPVFREHRLATYVDTYVLSYEHGIQKPDARLFEIACEQLGTAPTDVLMVGDDRRADGGAAALGCRIHFVDHLPAAQRPDALLPVLELVDRSATARPGVHVPSGQLTTDDTAS
jgi:putative hydrolase of the HAD superfamily